MPLDQHDPHLRHDLGEAGAERRRHVSPRSSRRWSRTSSSTARPPEGTDPVWRDYWNGGAPRGGPTVRAVQECVQSVLWNGSVGLAPLGHDLGDELVVVPLAGLPPSPS
ncbi:hypothetical protein [Lentzea sp. CC55]|uniref:hypothetical protein n=1 Tax=Lentzea sp. CC55 TaxID=2884909 RepID=UPI0027E0B459|nr:hypothetical protein [Lentzea sp. CC55]